MAGWILRHVMEMPKLEDSSLVRSLPSACMNMSVHRPRLCNVGDGETIWRGSEAYLYNFPLQLLVQIRLDGQRVHTWQLPRFSFRFERIGERDDGVHSRLVRIRLHSISLLDEARLPHEIRLFSPLLAPDQKHQYTRRTPQTTLPRLDNKRILNARTKRHRRRNGVVPPACNGFEVFSLCRALYALLGAVSFVYAADEGVGFGQGL